MASPKFEKFLTTAGVAQYPYITKPDGKFPKENPKEVYKCNLILPDDERTRALIEKLEGLRDAKYNEVVEKVKQSIEEAKPAQKKKLQKKLEAIGKAEVYEEHYDDAGEESGNIILKCKLNRKVINKSGEEFIQQPKVFDCSRPPQPLKGIDIWSGSVLKISGDVVPYLMESSDTVGVSLRMKGVQVVKLVSGGGADAASYGFEGDDGGFQNPEAEGAGDFAGDDIADDDEDF